MVSNHDAWILTGPWLARLRLSYYCPRVWWMIWKVDGYLKFWILLVRNLSWIPSKSQRLWLLVVHLLHYIRDTPDLCNPNQSDTTLNPKVLAYRSRRRHGNGCYFCNCTPKLRQPIPLRRENQPVSPLFSHIPY